MKLQAVPLELPGCYTVILPKFGDNRGSFFKLFHQSRMGAYLPGFLPREIYLTTSSRGVLRGMHFQVPPDDHAKVVISLSGRVSDVLLDLRPGPGYGAVTSVELSPEGQNAVLLPKGIAHGFYTHEDNSALLYLVETVHSPSKDRGIMWNSIAYDWPTSDPILSQRDQEHPALAQFVAPPVWAN